MPRRRATRIRLRAITAPEPDTPVGRDPTNALDLLVSLLADRAARPLPNAPAGSPSEIRTTPLPPIHPDFRDP
jgi:hypothetical protein